MKILKRLFRKKRSGNFTGFEVRFYLKGKLMTQNVSMARHWFHNYYHDSIRLSDNECVLGYKLEPIIFKERK